MTERQTHLHSLTYIHVPPKKWWKDSMLRTIHIESIKGSKMPLKSCHHFFWDTLYFQGKSAMFLFRCDYISNRISTGMGHRSHVTRHNSSQHPSNQNQAYSGTANRSSVLSCHSASAEHTHNERFRKMLQEAHRLHQRF